MLVRPTGDHIELFKSLYEEGLQWTVNSDLSSVIDYESVLIDPSRVWRIYVVDDGVAVGVAGLHRINMIDGSADMFLGVAADERRKGYCTAMLKELISLAFKSLNLRRLSTMVLENAPSRHVAENVGFKHEATLSDVRYKDGVYLDALVYTMFR